MAVIFSSVGTVSISLRAKAAKAQNTDTDHLRILWILSEEAPPLVEIFRI